MRRRIKKWNDGDSGTFSDGTRFKLSGVRSPEKHQYGGETATRRVAGMTERSRGFIS